MCDVRSGVRGDAVAGGGGQAGALCGVELPASEEAAGAGGKGQRIFSAAVLRLSITDEFGEGLEGVAEVDRVGGGGGHSHEPPGMDDFGGFDDDF